MKVAFNKSEVIALSSFRLSVRFDWRNFAFALAASFATFGFFARGSGTLSNDHHSSMLLVINMTEAAGTLVRPLRINKTTVLCYHVA